VKVRRILWLDQFVTKLEVKHHVTTFEVEEVLQSEIKLRRIAKGDVQGEDVYLALGKTEAGRYLSVFFILKKDSSMLPISARDMDNRERKQYVHK
jgi:uncharacterized DUF497 family protein